MKTETKYNYDFKNKKVKRAFQRLAFERGITLQQLITESLELATGNKMNLDNEK